MNREVWVFAQRENNKIAEISLELLGKGRELADRLKVSLAAVVIGNRTGELAPTLIAHGADKLYLARFLLFYFRKKRAAVIPSGAFLPDA